MRINQYIAQLGIASRREADELIAAGKIHIDGKRALVGQQVIGTEKISRVGVEQKAYTYLLYNKPVGVVTNLPVGDEREIKDIVKLPKDVFPIGRLDKDSRGLLLFTNDRRITGRLLTPDLNHEKEYIVTVDKTIPRTAMDMLARGVRIEDRREKIDYRTKPCKTKQLDQNTFSIILTEGKKRQIRRMCDTVGLHVNDLYRIRIMDFPIGKLRENSTRNLTKKEEKQLLATLKLK